MFDAKQFAMNFMSQNQNLPNNPMIQQCTTLIQTADAERGEEMANNILKSYGATSQQAQNQYLISQLRPSAVPAYLVDNPFRSTGNLPCQQPTCCNG